MATVGEGGGNGTTPALASLAASEPVQLDGVLRNTLFDEEGGYLGPLVTLKLDHLTELLVFNEGAVAGEFLFNKSKPITSVSCAES